MDAGDFAACPHGRAPSSQASNEPARPAPSSPVTQWSAAELVRRYEESVRSIRTVQADIRVVSGRTFPTSVVGLKRDDSGRAIVYEAKRLWNARTLENRLERSLLQIDHGVAFYSPRVAVSDGKRYEGYNPDPNSFERLGGLIAPDTAQLTGDYYWIPELLGFHFADGPERPLWELLKGANVIRVEGTPSHVVVLETTFKILDSNETRLRAWVDTSHGCLPARVEATRMWSNTLSTLIDIERFHEPAPESGFPFGARSSGSSSSSSLPRALRRPISANSARMRFVPEGGVLWPSRSAVQPGLTPTS